MPQILLTHLLHGSKFALSESEADQDEKNGWVRYTDATPALVEPEAEKPKRKYTRRTVDQTTEQPIEQPNGEEPVSDESEGN